MNWAKFGFWSFEPHVARISEDISPAKAPDVTQVWFISELTQPHPWPVADPFGFTLRLLVLWSSMT